MTPLSVVNSVLDTSLGRPILYLAIIFGVLTLDFAGLWAYLTMHRPTLEVVSRLLQCTLYFISIGVIVKRWYRQATFKRRVRNGDTLFAATQLKLQEVEAENETLRTKIKIIEEKE